MGMPNKSWVGPRSPPDLFSFSFSSAPVGCCYSTGIPLVDVRTVHHFGSCCGLRPSLHVTDQIWGVRPFIINIPVPNITSKTIADTVSEVHGCDISETWIRTQKRNPRLYVYTDRELQFGHHIYQCQARRDLQGKMQDNEIPSPSTKGALHNKRSPRYPD